MKPSAYIEARRSYFSHLANYAMGYAATLRVGQEDARTWWRRMKVMAAFYYRENARSAQQALERIEARTRMPVLVTNFGMDDRDPDGGFFDPGEFGR